MYSNQVYIMLQLLNYSKTYRYKRYKCFNDKLFIHKNTIAYLHKYMIHINQVFKVYYLQYIMNLCYIIIPSAYEWVSREVNVPEIEVLMVVHHHTLVGILVLV